MNKRQFIYRIILVSLIFLIGGPIVGFLLLALIIALISFDTSALLFFIFLPGYVMAILIGGVPALITGICFGVLREKSTDKFTVIIITLLVCFLTQSLFIFLIMGFELISMISMSILGVFSAFIIIFFTGYLKEDIF